MKRLALASLVALVLPAAAQGAPRPVSPRTIEAAPVSLAFGSDGVGLALWRGLRGSGPDSAKPFRALASGTAQGAWSAPRYLPGSVINAATVLAGPGRFALVTEREQPAGKAHTRSLITLTDGTLAPLTLGATTVLDRGPRTHVAFDGPRPTRFDPLVGRLRGRLIVAWQRSVPRSRSGVWAASVGGRSRLLGPFGASPALAIDPSGGGLLAWRRGSLILARTLRPAGSWGPIERVARVGRYAELAPLSIAGRRGRFAVAVTEIARSGHSVAWHATLHVRSHGWAGRTLANSSFTPTGATSYVTDDLRSLVTMTKDGRFHAVWPGRFGRQAAIDAVASGPDNRWAAVWFDGSPNLTTFGPVASTTNGMSTEPASDGAAVAYDPVSSAPVAIWAQGSPQAGGQQIVAGP